MKIVLKVLLILFTFQLITGCTAAIRGFPEPPITSTAVYPNPNYLLGDDSMQKYIQESDPTKKKALRNEIIDARMNEIDKKFADFERNLYAQGVGFGVGTDWTVLALAATTAIVHGEASKTALAAISTGVVGAAAAFDKRALFDMTLPTLIAQMVAQRESVRATIRAGEILPVESYTINAALSNLQLFEFAGSIPGSLQSIAEDAGQKTKTAKQEQKDILNASYVKTQDSELLRKFWKPDGKNIDQNNEKKLTDWMENNGLATTSGAITMFLYSDTLEQSRIKAVSDLGLQAEQKK